MSAIGERLRAERRRQGRSLADAAAETRVRESYLAAIEHDDFAPLGGDVYARGFIRMYARYLGLDHEEILAEFDANHTVGISASPFPAAEIDDVMPAGGGPRLPVSPPVLAAVGLVALLAIAFMGLRSNSQSSDDEVDPNAPGPSPAEVADGGTAPVTGPTDDFANTPADPLMPEPAEDEFADRPPMTELNIDVIPLRTVRLRVVRGQPPVMNAELGEGDARRITGDPAVIFQVSDAAAVEVKVNGQPLEQLGGDGQAVSVTCMIGNRGCDVRVL